MHLLSSLLSVGFMFSGADYPTPNYITAGDYSWDIPSVFNGNSQNFFNAANKLEDDFNATCKNTSCGGNYRNLRSLGITCSIRSEDGLVRKCVWTFAGAYDVVDNNTGHIATKHHIVTCDLGFEGDASKLATFFSREDGIRKMKVPGANGKTIWEIIKDCI